MKSPTILLMLCMLGYFGNSRTPEYCNRIVLKIITDNTAGADTIRVYYKKNTWGQSLRTKQSVVSGTAGLFVIPLEENEKGIYVSISGLQNTSADSRIYNFFAEAGDSIVCNYFNGNWYFDGRGSEKFRFQSDILKVGKLVPTDRTPIPDFKKIEDRTLHDSLHADYLLHSLRTLLKSYATETRLCLDILDWYKDKLSNFSYDILKVNIIALEEIRATDGYGRIKLRLSRDLRDTEFGRKVSDRLDAVFRDRRKVDYSEFQDSVLAFSDGFLDYKTFSRTDSAYLILKDHYAGFLRDRLLTTFFIKNMTLMPHAPLWLDRDISTISDNNCRDLLLPFISSMAKGMPAFDFELPDIHRKMIKLSDFKDKLVLLDFWYTGCGSCKILAQNMKPVSEHFKSNSKVAFVSISIDEDFEDWKKSVASGTYTNEGSTDLFTDSKRSEHPIIRHYGIVGYPTLILIDAQGKILTASPPRPSKTESGKVKELVDLIESNIK